MAGQKRPRAAMEAEDRGRVPSDDEPVVLGRQALPIARLPNDFNGDPMDGMQYLFTVRREARKLPSFTRVANPYAKTAAIPSIAHDTDQTASTSVKSEARARIPLPSEEWRAMFLQRLKGFRKNLLQPTIGVAIPAGPSGSKAIPEKKERDHWWAFLNGAPEAEWNPVKKPKPKRTAPQYYKSDAFTSDPFKLDDDLAQYEVTYEEESIATTVVLNELGEITDAVVSEQVYGQSSAVSLPTPFASPQPEDRYKASEVGNSLGKLNRPGRPKQPTPALLGLMDSRYSLHLLMYFTYWITQHLATLESPESLPSASSFSSFSHLTQTHARWIFALLTRVDAQLTSDELSHLRGLVRACIALLKDLNRNQVLVAGGESQSGTSLKWVGDPADAPFDERACWIIVTTITGFWGQKDLWMDAESILNGS